jgi:cobalt-zinc-cadmium resistance protein CzcA
MTITPDLGALARYGVSIEVQKTISVALGGGAVGQVFEGDRRFDIVVRLPENLRQDTRTLASLPVASPSGPVPANRAFVPLGQLAKVEVAPGPNQVSRENGKRRVVITSNVRGRDLGSFVEELREKVGQEVQLPEAAGLSMAVPSSSSSLPASGCPWSCRSSW